ncbi:anthocyanidin 3-O-glucoside 2'''-O-xylosyltransferase [Ranunculus cassubicifolius]
METSKKLHVVMFPWFAFGHISPFVQLSNKLSSFGIQISFLSAPGNIPRISASLDTSLPNVTIIPLEIPGVDGLPINLQSPADMTRSMVELLNTAVDQMQPQIKSLLTNLKPNFIFHEFIHHWLPDIANSLGVKSIHFSVFGALALAMSMVPARGENSTLEDNKTPPQGFPSDFYKTMKTYQARDLLYVFMSFDGKPSVYRRNVTSMKSCAAIIMKSCNEMEGPYIDGPKRRIGLLKKKYNKPILLLGPLVPNPPTQVLWANWLDQFPTKSVIFCSFGSETFLADEQIKELVLGLEQTGLPFIVVLNVEMDGKKRLISALPEGFEERVKGKGLVHTGWVQQYQILAHQSVGCFVCHAGLSSITEAVMNGCQMVLLPRKGDQFLNAKLIDQDMKAGVEVNTRDEDGYFTKKDLCAAVKTVMVDTEIEPGKTIRENNEKLRKFYINKETQEGFIKDVVKQLEEMAF